MPLAVRGRARRRFAAALLPLACAATMLASPATTAHAAKPKARPADRVVSATAVDSHTEAERVLGYWTKERMARAKPADRLLGTAAAHPRTPVPATGRPRRISALAVPAKASVLAKQSVLAKARGGGYDWDGPEQAPVTERTGKIFFTSQGIDYVCSGAAVTSQNRDVVWTAGHCVHAGDPHVGFHSNWVFVPGRHDGVSPYGVWTARLLSTTTGWARNGDLANDLGAAVTNPGGTLGLHLIDHVGGLGIGFHQPRSQLVYAFGFPAEAPYDGEHLIYCRGTAFDDPYDRAGLNPRTQGLDCDMGNGASGGPWLSDFDGSLGAVVSVSGYVYPGTPRVFAPYQGDTARTLYEHASAA